MDEAPCGFIGESSSALDLDAARVVLKKSQFNPMLSASILGRTGRFASFLTGAHVSDTSPKSTNRDNGAETSRVQSHVHTVSERTSL
jgi:hypothetical protein